MDLLSPHAPGRVLGIPGFHGRNPIRLYCARIFLWPNFRCLLLSCGLSRKLEMSTLRRVFLQSSIHAKSVRWEVFPLWTAKMVRLGDRRRRLPAEIPGRLENNQLPGSLMMLPRPIKEAVMVRPLAVCAAVSSSNRFDQVS